MEAEAIRLTRLRTLKRGQLLVAIATIPLLGAGLFVPGAMGILAMPLGVVYVVWATLAMRDRRLSMWLAALTTLMVALFLGAISASAIYFLVQAAEHAPVAQNWGIDATGKLVALSNPNTPGIQFANAGSYMAMGDFEKTQLILITIVALAAWAVVTLHAVEWRWLLYGIARSPARAES